MSAHTDFHGTIMSPRSSAELTVTAAEAFALGFEAYVWGYPLVLTMRTRDFLLSPARHRPTRINALRATHRLLTDRDREVVKPNNDTLFVIGWIDLSAAPVTLTVPDVQRYYSFQLMDAYTETWGYIGTRTTGTRAGTYTIAGPDPAGEQDADVLRSPTNTVWMLGRVLVNGVSDLPEAARIAESFHLSGPDTRPGPDAATPAPSPHGVGAAGLAFFDELGTALIGNPPPDTDRDLLARLEAIGIGAGRTPSADITDVAVRESLAASVAAAHASIAASDLGGLSASHGDWTYDLNIGSYHGDHLLRSVTALRGLGALTADEAVYANAGADADGERFDGTHRYLLRFGADQLPPVDGFWSLTLYDDNDFLTANPIDRFTISDRSTQLHYGPDGSLSIVISHDAPDETSNWLPAPRGRFQLTLRCYTPRAALLRGEYVVPSVQRL
ncbi:DUF1254 domain-containing protein [Mycobacterium sp. NPDC003449]